MMVRCRHKCLSQSHIPHSSFRIPIVLFLLAQAGCIPHYSDFVGTQDSKKDMVGDVGLTDADKNADTGSDVRNPDGPTDVQDVFDHVAPTDVHDAGIPDINGDTKDGQDTHDVPDLQPQGCGDGECTGDETCESCPGDCGCLEGEVCWQQDCCQPDCASKECGANGCGGSCGPCPEGKLCSGFVCIDGPCTHECSYDGQKQCQDAGYKECGYDYDGDSCLEWSDVISCPPGNVCDNGECVCVPDCVGKECGDDGCGGNCGDCQSPMSCAGGICIGCGDGECDPGEHECNCPADCIGDCPGCCAGTECKTGDVLSFCGIGGEVCDECAGGEACQAGKCACTPEDHAGCSGEKLYWYDSCNVQGDEIGDCDESIACTSNVDCMDINPCTIDYCAQDPGVPYKTCHYKSPDGVQCCTGDNDCNDGNLCTTDGCSGNQCTQSNKGDDTPCGNDKSCQSGVCKYHCGDGLCAGGGGDTCLDCPDDCGPCPAEILCKASGGEGQVVHCTLNVARTASASPEPTALNFRVVFDDTKLAFSGFSCLEDAVDFCETVDMLPTGHSIHSYELGPGSINVLVSQMSGVPESITTAYQAGDDIVGDPYVMELVFVLKASVALEDAVSVQLHASAACGEGVEELGGMLLDIGILATFEHEPPPNCLGEECAGDVTGNQVVNACDICCTGLAIMAEPVVVECLGMQDSADLNCDQNLDVVDWQVVSLIVLHHPKNGIPDDKDSNDNNIWDECEFECGDGLCDNLVGENCSNCVEDCGCAEGGSCSSGVCCPSGQVWKCGGCYAENDPGHCGQNCLECWEPTAGAELSCPADNPDYCCYNCPGSEDTCCVPPGAGVFIKCWEMDCS